MVDIKKLSEMIAAALLRDGDFIEYCKKIEFPAEESIEKKPKKRQNLRVARVKNFDNYYKKKGIVK